MARRGELIDDGGLLADSLVAANATDRDRLLKGVPSTIPDLVSEFGKTCTSADDQLVLTSLDIELKAAGLDWFDLSNLLRFQVVAHRAATMRGVCNAALNHPNNKRLREHERNFLSDCGKRNKLLTDKQLGWLQSIIDSLDLSEDEWAIEQVARQGWEKRRDAA